MTPDQKPEWFQIADADKAASVRKVSKKLPILTLVAVAGILSVGAVMAQTQEEPPAVATETVAPATPVATTTSTPTATPTSTATVSKKAVASSKPRAHKKSAAPSASTPAVPANATTASTAPAPAPAPAKSGITTPKIGKLPKGGEHEGGEHEGGGKDD